MCIALSHLGQSFLSVTLLSGWRRWLRSLVVFLLGAAAFAIAYTQWPLFAENQHTKFLHGLAAAGYGNLRADWLANTVDPLPAFSALVAMTYGYLDPNFFYLYHALLLGVYLFSLLGIVNQTLGLRTSPVAQLLFAVTMIALFAGQLPPFSWPALGTSVSWLLQAGVANQYLINPAFQPSTFGVLLIFSIYLYLTDRGYWASVAAAAAAVMHSTYLPGAAVLVMAYMALALYADRTWRRPLAIGLLALMIVTPVLIYNYLFLGPTSAAQWAQAQNIIVRFRIPHHSLPEIWLDKTVYVKIALVMLALLLARRTRLAAIMGFAGLFAILLTFVQLRWPNDTLAFVAPWRISVFLAPLSSAVIVGALALRLVGGLDWLSGRLALPALRLRLLVGGVALALLVVLMSQGGAAMARSVNAQATDYHQGLYAFAAADGTARDLYLVPSGMAEFRLETGIPVLVTFKSHPYKDTEVIEWQERVNAANAFYSEPTCDAFLALADRYAITHVVLTPTQLPDGCLELELRYADDSFRVLQVVR